MLCFITVSIWWAPSHRPQSYKTAKGYKQETIIKLLSFPSYLSQWFVSILGSCSTQSLSSSLMAPQNSCVRICSWVSGMILGGDPKFRGYSLSRKVCFYGCVFEEYLGFSSIPSSFCCISPSHVLTARGSAPTRVHGLSAVTAYVCGKGWNRNKGLWLSFPDCPTSSLHVNSFPFKMPFTWKTQFQLIST